MQVFYLNFFNFFQKILYTFKQWIITLFWIEIDSFFITDVSEILALLYRVYRCNSSLSQQNMVY